MPVDWTSATEAGREQKIAVVTQLDCALNGLERERGERSQMVALVLRSLTLDQPSSTLGVVEILKLSLTCTSNFACPRCSGQREPQREPDLPRHRGQYDAAPECSYFRVV